MNNNYEIHKSRAMNYLAEVLKSIDHFLVIINLYLLVYGFYIAIKEIFKFIKWIAQ